MFIPVLISKLKIRSHQPDPSYYEKQVLDPVNIVLLICPHSYELDY